MVPPGGTPPVPVNPPIKPNNPNCDPTQIGLDIASLGLGIAGEALTVAAVTPEAAAAAGVAGLGISIASTGVAVYSAWKNWSNSTTEEKDNSLLETATSVFSTIASIPKFDPITTKQTITVIIANTWAAIISTEEKALSFTGKMGSILGGFGISLSAVDLYNDRLLRIVLDLSSRRMIMI